ncbi:MAG: hypothetical protein ABSF15_11200 [Candidatus Sulfotelmatobacter sp.]
MINCRTVEKASIPSTPPSCSDCTTKTQAAGGTPPTQSASRMWRSGNGKMRIDTPHTSVISDPAGQRTIMLDHLKKEAMVFPIPPSAPPSQSGGPQMPGGAPKLPPLQVHDLGKSLIEGHEVEGKRYTFSPPQAPQAPQPPEMPKMPKMPKPPQSPKPPLPPKPPQLPKPPQPTVTEVWTSVKLKMPILTKVTSSVGEQTTYCKPTSTEEPHPSVFEIPPGYKLKT